MAMLMKNEPHITVGIMDRRKSVEGRLNGAHSVGAIGPKTRRLAGGFSASAAPGEIVLCDATGRVVGRSHRVRIEGGGRTTFDLFGVTIGRHVSLGEERGPDLSRGPGSAQPD